MFKDSSVTTSIKQAIEEKTNEIQQLEIQIGDLQHSLQEAESREEQYRAEINKKDEEIKSLKDSYEVKLADKDRELQMAREETAKLKQSNKEREKELMDELAQTKEEYKEKLKELESAKEVECLKLRLKHSEETKGLELQIKDLQRELAEKKVTVGELEKKQLRQQLEEQQKK